MVRPDVPSTLTFTANVSERQIGALLQGLPPGTFPYWSLVIQEKRRPDEVRVKVTYEVIGITQRQRKIFLQAMKDKANVPRYHDPRGPARGDV